MQHRLMRIAYLTIAIFFGVLSSSTAQFQQQIDVSDTYVEAWYGGDWNTVKELSAQMLLSQIDSAKFAAIVPQVKAKLGDIKSRWLSSVEETKGYFTIMWNARFDVDSMAFKLILDKDSKVTGIWLRAIESPYKFPPPPYADESKFEETRGFFGPKGMRLPGTVTMPKGEGPFPMIVMVSGSGPNDRDETAYGNKPFRDIAWGLATQGIATFRYDKRTLVHTKSFDPNIHSVEEEVILDALEALKDVVQQKNIDRNKIFLLGHSLGGMFAPEIARRSSNTKGVIMLAAPARDFIDVAVDQLTFLRTKVDPQKRDELAYFDAQLAAAKRMKEGKALEGDTFLGLPSSYYEKMSAYDLVKAAKELTIPMFIAQGGKDYQVTEKEFAIWKKELSGSDRVTFREYDDCYHLFIPTDEEPGKTNYAKEGHVTKALIDDIVQWIDAR